ncbi:MAG: HEPN domain-containing protein [Gammaproteobacteria bacterium]
MSFENRFNLADDYLNHVNNVITALPDDFIKSRYLGFLAISAVTAYELAIKDIFYRFSDQKHRALGELARSKFEKLNGQIRLKDLRDRHIKSFGQKYCTRFIRELDKVEQSALASRNGSVKSSYGNLVMWRHNFVHQGEWPNTATYGDLTSAYDHGKELIRCIDRAMQR